MPATDPDWEFDYADPSLALSPHEVFAAFRQRCPVVRTEAHGGYWAVLGHQETREVFDDAATYSSAEGVTFPPVVVVAGTPRYPIEADLPEHTSYRRVLESYFTPEAVAGHEDVLRVLIRERLHQLRPLGRADLVETVAAHLPPIAIALMLGLPAEDGELVGPWTGQLFDALEAEDYPRLGRLHEAFAGYLAEQTALQRAAGEDTLLTAIARARVDGQPLGRDERTGMLLLLVLAGHEITVTSIGTLLYHLATVDGLRERLIAEPELIPAMIDECLRLESPDVVISRVARKDTELAGRPIAAGDRLVLVLSSANRDPTVFAEPEEFRCPRPDNPHLSFGYGIHRCIGEHLARLEMRVVVEEMLELMPGYRLTGEPTWRIKGMLRGLATLPAEWDSGVAGPA